MSTLEKIRKQSPLILNITNEVTADFVANGLLCLGASPIMSQAIEEIPELLQLAQSLVINLGTLHRDFLALCRCACKYANRYRVPILLDPVGAGATNFRTQAAQELLQQFSIAMIRGNASEIAALANNTASSKGVDSDKDSEAVIEQAQHLAQQHQLCVVVSGKVDVVVDEFHWQRHSKGSHYQSKITGCGCLFSAVVAAFHSVQPDRFMAANHATDFYGSCGELAALHYRGLGSYKTRFLDALSTL